MQNRIMIIAGEASGDLHGSGLVRELKRLDPSVELFGIGGDRMQQNGMELIYHIDDMGIMGFAEVIKQLPFIKRVLRRLTQLLNERKPQLLILIDYPGLNLKLAEIARTKAVKVLYYIAPQVWAWGVGRIKKLAQRVNKMAVVLPFEEQMFQAAKINATFVGHPLLEVLKTKLKKQEFVKIHDLDSGKKILGLLPGSRPSEVRTLLPEMIKSVHSLTRSDPSIQVVVSRAPTVKPQTYFDILPDHSSIKLLDDSTYEIMAHSDLLIVASGTATLEAAFFETPMIVVYKVDPLSWLLGKALVKIDNISLVNIIAGKRVVPELLQKNFRAEKLSLTIKTFLADAGKREQMKNEIRLVKHKLGQAGASRRTAEMAFHMLNAGDVIVKSDVQ